MNFRHITSTILLFVLTITAVSAQFSFGNYALQHVNIIDVNKSEILYDYTIVISNDKISDIIPSKKYIANDTVQTIGLKGKFVVSGEQKKPKFSIDRNQSGYSGARVFGVTITESEINLKFLLAVLNSKVITFVIHSTFPIKAGGYFSMSSTFVEKLPIIQLSTSNQKPLIDLTTKILEAKQKGEDTSTLELEVDQLVYQLYDLTEEEIKIALPS